MGDVGGELAAGVLQRLIHLTDGHLRLLHWLCGGDGQLPGQHQRQNQRRRRGQHQSRRCLRHQPVDGRERHGRPAHPAVGKGPGHVQQHLPGGGGAAHVLAGAGGEGLFHLRAVGVVVSRPGGVAQHGAVRRDDGEPLVRRGLGELRQQGPGVRLLALRVHEGQQLGQRLPGGGQLPPPEGPDAHHGGDDHRQRGDQEDGRSQFFSHMYHSIL